MKNKKQTPRLQLSKFIIHHLPKVQLLHQKGGSRPCPGSVGGPCTSIQIICPGSGTCAI
jgi:hypothetical protein